MLQPDEQGKGPFRGKRERPLNSGHVETRTLAWPLETQPYLPAPYDKSDIAAIKALAEGRADAYQQQRALEWIVYICGTYENPYRPTERDTVFAAAKQWVGQQIVKLINLPAKDARNGEQG